MAKAILKDGRVFRLRRGEIVEVPARWVGNLTTQQTIRKRPSKLTGKVKRIVKDRTGDVRYKDARQEPLDPLES